MTSGEAFWSGFEGWNTFSGRSNREEFWRFYLGYLTTMALFSFVGLMFFSNPLIPILVVVTVFYIPIAALTARRLRDCGLPPPLALMALLPLVCIGWWGYRVWEVETMYHQVSAPTSALVLGMVVPPQITITRITGEAITAFMISWCLVRIILSALCSLPSYNSQSPAQSSNEVPQ